MKEGEYQICSRSVLDSSVPGIHFDENGVANYCQIYDHMASSFPLGEVGKAKWQAVKNKISAASKNKKYNCIVGLSGGVDSSYLLHLAVKEGFRPLAVYLDNGWSSKSSLHNIKLMTQALNVDLETFVLDYEEIKDLMKSYMKAGLPWIDFPTDFAIQASLFKMARKEKIKHILIGYDFRCEGKQPTEWTYGDFKQLKYVHKKFGKVKLKNYPGFRLFNLLKWSMFNGIKMLRPYYFLKYDKQSAKKFLIENYNWMDYGGHHHENSFTKYAIACWLPKKFNIDKRRITLSAQVMSKQITRQEALQELKSPACTDEECAELTTFIKAKLNLSDEEFIEIWNKPNKYYYDYPSNFPLLQSMIKVFVPLFKHIFPWKPALFFEMEVRNKK